MSIKTKKGAASLLTDGSPLGLSNQAISFMFPGLCLYAYFLHFYAVFNAGNDITLPDGINMYGILDNSKRGKIKYFSRQAKVLKTA